MGIFKQVGKRSKAGNGRDFTRRDRGILILEDLGLTAAIAWVFYDSPLALCLFPLVAVFNHRRFAAAKEEKWQDAFSNEYREFLVSLTGALQTGYSVERAFEEVEITLASLFGNESVLGGAIHEVNQKVRMQTPVEKAFVEMSDRFGNEEMTGFAEVFRFAKRLGGNYVENIKRCAEKISDRLELEGEIRMAIAEKKLELKVMMAMPMGILAYMRISSPDFMSSVYHNTPGICLMTGCIIVYVFSIMLGKRITEIKV